MPAQYPLEFDMKGSGFKVNETAGEALFNHALVYRGVDGNWWLADADSAASMPVLGITMGAIPAGRKGEVLELGYIGDNSWAWTAGEEIYATGTPGVMSHTPPAGVGDIVQVVAIAVTSVIIQFTGKVGGAVGASNTLEGETAFVGFDPSKDHYVNYFYCDGVADDVQIQAAINYIIVVGGGTILLEEGTYDISSSLIIDDNNIVLTGIGSSTILDSSLGVGENVINIIAAPAGRSGVSLKSFKIQGNGTEQHGVFISDTVRTDGITLLTILDVGGDGIHVEGCFSFKIYDNYIGFTNRGIFIGVSASRNSHALNVYSNTFNAITAEAIWVEGNPTGIMVRGNDITTTGGDAIHVYQASGIKIIDNYIETAGDDGIHVGADASNASNGPIIQQNCVFTATTHGIHIDNCDRAKSVLNFIGGVGGNKITITAASDEAFIEERYTIADAGTETVRYRNLDGIFQVETGQGIGYPIFTDGTRPIAATAGRVIYNSDTEWMEVDDGTNWHTRKPTVFIPATDPDTAIGTHPATLLPDGVDTTVYTQLIAPYDLESVVAAYAIVVPGGTGDIRRRFDTNFGGAGEVYNTHTDSYGVSQVAVTINELEFLDMAPALTGLTAGDVVGVTFQRAASHVMDTVNADCYFLGLVIRYV